MHQDRHLTHDSGNDKLVTSKRRKRRRRQRIFTTVALSVLFLAAVGGTVAFLITQDGPVTNTFIPSQVSCQVTENFNGTEKTNVNVKNTGDTQAYIRVKLVTYRVNEQGQRIGGSAEIPVFLLGENWVTYDGFYYYTLPVAAGDKPATDLADKMTLTGAYSDADGGKQVIEVMAEAIQSEPAQAVGEAWGVSISEGRVAAYQN